MTVAEFLAHLQRIKRQAMPPVTISMSVFTDDDRVPVRVSQ